MGGKLHSRALFVELEASCVLPARAQRCFDGSMSWINLLLSSRHRCRCTFALPITLLGKEEKGDCRGLNEGK